jgi:hypothetical protein
MSGKENTFNPASFRASNNNCKVVDTKRTSRSRSKKRSAKLRHPLTTVNREINLTQVNRVNGDS